jgi:hypothetical protein
VNNFGGVMKVLLILALTICSACIALGQESLPAQVHRLNRDFETQDWPDYVPADLGKVANEADIIMLGKITGSSTRLNKEQQGLRTDYQFDVRKILKPEVPSKQQGTITVRRTGGIMFIEGHKVTHTVAHTPLFETGRDYILFLRFDPTSNTYELAHGPFGMYEVKGNRIETVEDLGEYNQRYNHMDIADFSKLVHESIEAKGSDKSTTSQQNP